MVATLSADRFSSLGNTTNNDANDGRRNMTIEEDDIISRLCWKVYSF
jgi:hypothetical protein